MRPIGIQQVTGFGSKRLAAGGGQLAVPGHADGWINLGTKPAERAETQVKLGAPDTMALLDAEGARWASRRRGASITPLGEIDFRAAPRPFGKFGRCEGVLRGDDAGGNAFAQEIEHN